MQQLPEPALMPIAPYRLRWRSRVPMAEWHTKYFARCAGARAEQRQYVDAGYCAEVQKWNGERWVIV